MRQDLNLERQEEDYEEARENQIQKIIESENVSHEVATQIWEDHHSSAEE